MKNLRRMVIIVGCAWAVNAAGAELDEFIQRDDPSFSWKVTETRTSKAGKLTDIALVSQTWKDLRWEHRLRVYEATVPTYPDAMLLFITGGSTGSTPSAQDEAQGLKLSQLSGARVAVLSQVPNQPLLGGKKEDTLIAETFVRYLDTKDANWPLLFPMVKSAVRAMDAVQAWTKAEGARVPARFVVTGASKRGWTTWLTAAADRRVIALAPMVIDTLNFPGQRDHWMEAWGKPSGQIRDYTERGLNEAIDTPDGKRLWRMVDPYEYRDRLTQPKLLINGTNDEYWTLDALNIYWDDLKGPKAIVYLPNAGHSLGEHREYALCGIGAITRLAVTGRSLPALTWTHSDAEDGSLRLAVVPSVPPRSARAWVARAETRDFRKARWDEAPLRGDGSSYQFRVRRPESGFVALLGDLEFEIDGVPYHLSTQIRQAGARKEPARRRAAGAAARP